MALVNIQNIQFQNNPCPFLSPFRMDVTFECLKPIKEDIDWSLVYIGSAKDEQYDQVLDKFQIGNLEKGVMQFSIETNPPDHLRIPSKDDLLGVTAIILTVSYRGQEFFRVGYYVYNQYTDPELIENDPPQILIDKVERSIFTDQPRITHFNIKWGTEDETKGVDPNTRAIIQQNELLNNQARNDINAVNTSMMQQLPDPFSKPSGILQELSGINSMNQQLGQSGAQNFMFSSGCDIPNAINNNNQFQTNPYPYQQPNF